MRTRRTSSSSDPVPSVHQSVLLHEAIESLDIQLNDTIVDATLGGAGHARAIAGKLGNGGTLVGFDLDADAIERAKLSLADSSTRIELVEANFRTLGTALPERGIAAISKVLFDLGWSSFQLGAGRGFSFLTEEPLLMTYSKDPQALTARTIVNSWAEESIADVIWGYGGERFARRIAKAIIDRREKEPIETSTQLAEIVKASVPSTYRYGRIHPATKTFQALRIAVNDELGALEEGMAATWKLLVSGGRIAVITFHSLEDRAVKQRFVEWEKTGAGKRITKKPIVPSEEELRENPRARSAKLRVIQKI